MVYLLHIFVRSILQYFTKLFFFKTGPDCLILPNYLLSEISIKEKLKTGTGGAQAGPHYFLNYDMPLLWVKK